MKKKNRRLENVIYEFKHNKQAIFAAIYLCVIICISIFVVFVNVDPDAIDVTHKLEYPSGSHWFGTDEMGQDYFIRVLYGGRVSLLVGVLAMVTSILIGVAVGLMSGYFGGLVDSLLMRLVDVFSSIPWIIMVTVFGLLFKRGLFPLLLSSACSVGWELPDWCVLRCCQPKNGNMCSMQDLSEGIRRRSWLTMCCRPYFPPSLRLLRRRLPVR